MLDQEWSACTERQSRDEPGGTAGRGTARCQRSQTPSNRWRV